jgi:hypothetical protein
LTSHVSFIAIDPRPEHYIETTCTYWGIPEINNGSIFPDGWWPCDDEDVTLQFWLGEDFLSLWRSWEMDPGEPLVYTVSSRIST